MLFKPSRALLRSHPAARSQRERDAPPPPRARSADFVSLPSSLTLSLSRSRTRSVSYSRARALCAFENKTVNRERIALSMRPPRASARARQPVVVDFGFVTRERSMNFTWLTLSFFRAEVQRCGSRNLNLLL